MCVSGFGLGLEALLLGCPRQCALAAAGLLKERRAAVHSGFGECLVSESAHLGVTKTLLNLMVWLGYGQDLGVAAQPARPMRQPWLLC